MSKKILVIGATGKIGTPVVERLLAEGYHVRAGARSNESVEALTAKGVDARVIDTDVAVDVEHFRDISSALLLTPANKSLEAVSKALIDVSKQAEVGRVVRISIDSAAIEKKTMLGVAHGNADDYLASSGLRHTILRPSGFMQNFLGMAPMIQQGILVAPTENGAVPFIDSRDIADAAVAVLTDESQIDGPVDVSGPEALSFADVASKLSTRLGREIAHVSPSPEDAREGLQAAGFDGWLLEAMLEDTAHTAAGHSAEVKTGILTLTGRRPRTFDNFLDEHIGEFVR